MACICRSTARATSIQEPQGSGRGPGRRRNAPAVAVNGMRAREKIADFSDNGAARRRSGRGGRRFKSCHSDQYLA
jgi:hypothetical protein